MSKWRSRVECGDSLSRMRKLEAGSVGAVISDPPFFTGMGRPTRGGNAGFGDDPWADISSVEKAAEWAEPYTREFARVTRKGGAVVLMCGVHASAAWMLAAEKAGLIWMAELDVLWNTGKPRKRNFGSLHTHILWFTISGARHEWNSAKLSIYSNLIVARKVPIQHREHPAQKPIELTNFLVSLLTRRNDVILDPFCGSGSTLVSAALCDRSWLGIDQDNEYCEIARRRVANADNEEEGVLGLWMNMRTEEV